MRPLYACRSNKKPILQNKIIHEKQDDARFFRPGGCVDHDKSRRNGILGNKDVPMNLNEVTGMIGLPPVPVSQPLGTSNQKKVPQHVHQTNPGAREEMVTTPSKTSTTSNGSRPQAGWREKDANASPPLTPIKTSVEAGCEKNESGQPNAFRLPLQRDPPPQQ